MPTFLSSSLTCPARQLALCAGGRSVHYVPVIDQLLVGLLTLPRMSDSVKVLGCGIAASLVTGRRPARPYLVSSFKESGDAASWNSTGFHHFASDASRERSRPTVFNDDVLGPRHSPFLSGPGDSVTHCYARGDFLHSLVRNQHRRLRLVS